MPCLGNCSQGRTDCPHKVQCKAGRVEQRLTDWGLLADDRYSEPDTIDLKLPEISPLERLIIGVALAAAAFAMAGLVVSCAMD